MFPNSIILRYAIARTKPYDLTRMDYFSVRNFEKQSISHGFLDILKFQAIFEWKFVAIDLMILSKTLKILIFEYWLVNETSP